MKTDDELFQTVRQILAKKLQLAPAQIVKGSHLIDDLGVDSIDFWEIIAKVEQEFGITVKDDEVKDVKTVQDVVDILRNRLGAAQK